MKALVLSAVWLSVPYLAVAQTPSLPAGSSRHLVSVGILGLAANAGLQYEFRVTRHFTGGLQGAYYFSPQYPGYQVALVGRYYFRPLARAGFYLQSAVGRYYHHAQMVVDFPGHYSVGPRILSHYGPSLGLGYRRPLTPHLVLQATVGLKFYLHDLNVKCDCAYVGDWYATGQPGSLLDGQLSLGYAF
jgi:hypothetical protein